MTAPRRVMPHRMVVDPNVFISALMAKPGSPNLAVAQAVTTNKLILVACPALLQELSDVTHRERFRRWFSLEDAQRLVDALALIAEMHPDPPTVPPVCADPDDDYLFALADAADTRVIVSGDRKVQAVEMLGIDVRSPRAVADELNKLLAMRHPWGPGMIPANPIEALQLAAIRGDDKVLLVAASFRSLLRGKVRRHELARMVTPEAMPSLFTYRREVDKLLRDRGMSNLVEYQSPDVAMVKMTDDPGHSVRATAVVSIQMVPVVLHRRPDLPHDPETGGWRVHHVGGPTRETPGYAAPAD